MGGMSCLCRDEWEREIDRLVLEMLVLDQGHIILSSSEWTSERYKEPNHLLTIYRTRHTSETLSNIVLD